MNAILSAHSGVPVFADDFDQFMLFLSDVAAPALLSPKRYAAVLQLDLQTLAMHARVHRNTITRAPQSESIQKFLRESVRILRAAVDLRGNVETALFWYKNEPIQTFDYKTPHTLVAEGRSDALIRYLQSLQAGFTG